MFVFRTIRTHPVFSFDFPRITSSGLCLISIFLILSILSPTTRGTLIEDKFYKEYGNHVNESGVWEPLCRTRNGRPDILVNISNQAHVLANIGPPNVNAFAFYTKTLKYLDCKYQPINIDLIFYAVGMLNSTQVDPRFWFITKGLRPDCVYYLRPIDETANEFYLTDQHICGIKIPVKVRNITSLYGD